MRWGPNLGAYAPEVPRFRDGSPRPPSARLQVGSHLRRTNAPYGVTLPRRTGLGFTLQPHHKLEKEEDDDQWIEDLDVGLVGALLLDLDI